MAGRPSIFDEQKVIEKAIEIFWVKGYEATSLDTLLQAMGIGKGSFYLAFKGGKRELFEKSLIQFSNKRLTNFKKAASISENPIKLIKDFFLSVSDSNMTTHQNGCYLGNAIAEMANIEPCIQNKAIDLLKELEMVFESIIKKAQTEDMLKSKEKPDLIAKNLINVWNGINITRRMYPDRLELKKIIELQLQVLN